MVTLPEDQKTYRLHSPDWHRGSRGFKSTAYMQHVSRRLNSERQAYYSTKYFRRVLRMRGSPPVRPLRFGRQGS